MSKQEKEAMEDRGGLLLVPSTKKRSTQKPSSEEKWNDINVITPPYNPSDLSDLYETDNTLRKCVDYLATNTFGEGYTIESIKNPEDPNIEKANEFMANINPDLSFKNLVSLYITDRKTTGYAAWEVARNQNTNLPENIYHIPAATVRVAKPTDKEDPFRAGQRFVQVEDFNTKIQTWYNRYYARKADRVPENGYNPELNQEKGTGLITNEVMWFKEANPKNRFYGLPPNVTLFRTVLLTKYAQEFNIDQFENGMLQKFLLLVHGGKITKNSIEGLRTYFEEMRQRSKRANVPLVQATGANSKISVEKISADVQESSFLKTQEFNSQEVLLAYGISPILLGMVKNTNRATAIEERKKTYEDEIRPLEEEIETRFTRMFQEDFGWDGLVLKAKPPNFADRKIENDIRTAQYDRGILSINEIRASQGLEPIEGGDVYYINTPLGPVLVEDLPSFGGAGGTEQAANKRAEMLVNGMVNFKEQLEAKVREKKIMDGTEENDEKYIEDEST
jgi:capsid portal protein